MPKFEIEYTEEQLKAVSSYVEDPLAWLQHAWNNKARKRTDAIIEETTDKRASKLSGIEKEQIVRDADIPTATQRREEEKQSEI